MSEAAEMPVMPKVETKGGVVAYLSIEGALKAAEFYRRAFAAEDVFHYPPDDKGRTMHVHIHINGSSVMIGDFYEEYGHQRAAPAGFSLALMVSDVQAWFDRAVAAGCEPRMPPQEMFWGDTYAEVRDPFGVQWSMNQPRA